MIDNTSILFADADEMTWTALNSSTGKVIHGYLEYQEKDTSLVGVTLSSYEIIITAITAEITGMKVDDTITYNSKDYTVSFIRNDIDGISRVQVTE